MARVLIYFLYGLAACFFVRAVLQARAALERYFAAPPDTGGPTWFDLLLPNPTLLFEIAALAALAEVLRLCLRMNGTRSSE